MAKPQEITDERIVSALDLYARMVGRVLADPQRWLGLDDEPPPSAPFPAKVLDALRDRALGDTTPASAAWTDQPLQRRVDWWVTRIGVSAGLFGIGLPVVDLVTYGVVSGAVLLLALVATGVASRRVTGLVTGRVALAA